MQCLTPYIKYRTEREYDHPTKFHSDVVPCGQCTSCLKLRQYNWIFRLQQEQKRSLNASFLTLTYNDYNLPWSEKGYPTLDRTAHQSFIKRLRSNISNQFPEEIKGKIKYYAIGEYGTENHRPHYHSIIFNLPKSYLRHSALITKDWQKGNTKLIVCNPKTIAYVTGYINKTLFTDGQDEDDDRKKEFSNISKGIGENYITPKIKAYYKKVLTPYLSIQNGDKIPLPRYYKNKLYTKAEQEILLQKSKMHIDTNPQFRNPQHREDLVRNQLLKLKTKNLLNKRNNEQQKIKI